MRRRRNFSPPNENDLKMSNWRIPLSDLDYGQEESIAVQRVLDSRWLSMGTEVSRFEEQFAAMCGVKHAIAVSNGTAALHLSFLALGIGSGDEILQPALNFVAAANMTIAIGATPVFGDIISLDEPTISPDEIKKLLTPRTKAIVVMHYGGYSARMAEIKSICNDRHVALVEDACHAVGSRYFHRQNLPPHGSMVGALGDVACFSFFGNKNLATGEGGMITTDRDDLAEKLRKLRSHGMTTLTWDRHMGHANGYDVVTNGFNCRMDEIHAALGTEQLKKLKKGNARRGELTQLYRAKLSQLAGWTLPFLKYKGDSSCHLMVVLAPDKTTRTNILARLKEQRIQTSQHYPCIPDFSAFSKWRLSNVPLTREFAGRVMTLPLYPGMTEKMVDEVCQTLGTAK